MLEFWNNIPLSIFLLRISFGIFLLYVVGPVLIKCIFLYRIPTDILILDPNDDLLPDSVRTYLDDQFKQLSDLGFQIKGTFALPKLVPNVASINVLHLNECTGDSAMVSMLWTHSNQAKIKLNYVEFVRRFSSGSMLQTNNSSRVGSFVSPSDHLTLQLPNIHKLSELYGIHTRASDSFGSGRPLLTLIEDYHGNVESFVQERVLDRPAAYQVQRGLLRTVEEGYRLTWIGAYVMGWQELFPIKQIIRWNRLRASRHWLMDRGIA